MSLPSSFVRVRALPPALALLAGCVTTAPAGPSLPRHVAPTSGPTARLLVRAAVPAGDLYGVYLHDDALACTGPRIAGAGNATRQPAATAIAAGQLTTLDFTLFKPSKAACTVRWSFTPEAGKTYLVTGLGNAAGCSARVLDATDPDAIKPVAQALRRNSATRQCMGLDEARAAAANAPVGGQAGGDAVLRPGATGDDLKGLLPP
ncbi:MAG TPA: hypothetical protein VFQ20_00780 [Burkholderiaceae bacterium]|nr:hypothetical protein [Burkholderiaceae bacterium]